MGYSKTNSDAVKKNLIEAMEKSMGIVTKACKEVKCCRDTYYRYYKEDEEFARKIDSIADIALDFAESALHDQISAGIPTSTIFYLKTKGKNRGYIESMEHLGNKDKPLGTTINFNGKDIPV